MHSLASLTLRRALAVTLVAGTLASLAACQFDRTTLPTGNARPVVHAVLNPFTASAFTVLLERTLSGRVSVQEGKLDTADVVVTGGGDPITGARVTIYNDELQDNGVGIEAVAQHADGKGRGVYVFLNVGCGAFSCPSNGILLRRGMTYRLDIQTPTGEHLTATTQIPIAFARPDTGSQRTFDAVHDTYVFSWPKAETLDRYAVQVQTPYGPFQTFSDVESLAVNGTLRNFQQDRFPRVFVPGFRQALQAIAVERNYFDYYRSANDPFTGQGLVSRIEGGTGLFGAIHPIRYQELDVTGPFDDAVDGQWRLIGDTTGFPPRLTTYSDGTLASGRLEDVFSPDFVTRRGVLGTRSGSRLQLAVLQYFSARDTAWTMTAEVRGDTLYTHSTQKGDQRWRRTSQAP